MTQNTSATVRQRRIEADEAFYRQLIVCEEERTVAWFGDYRWFAADNVLQLEQYRSEEDWTQTCERLRVRGVIG